MRVQAASSGKAALTTSEEEAQVRAPGPIVLWILTVPDDLHHHELVRIVAGDAVEVIGLHAVHTADCTLSDHGTMATQTSLKENAS